MATAGDIDVKPTRVVRDDEARRDAWREEHGTVRDFRRSAGGNFTVPGIKPIASALARQRMQEDVE